MKKYLPVVSYRESYQTFNCATGLSGPQGFKKSYEIVEGVRKNGVPVEYVLFEDEGHGFVEKENQIEAHENTLKFLEKYLRADTTEVKNNFKT